jgi:hypothetical protein
LKKTGIGGFLILKILKKPKTKEPLVSNFFKQTELDVIKKNQIAGFYLFIYLCIFPVLLNVG